MATDGFLMMDLLRAYYWLDEALQTGLRAHGWTNVSRSQSLILINVASGVQRASVLATQLGISRQAISQMLNEMQAAGLVEMKPDPQDKRAQCVTFSSKSAKLRDDAMDILRQVEGEIGRRLGKKRMTAMREALAQNWGVLPEID